MFLLICYLTYSFQCLFDQISMKDQVLDLTDTADRRNEALKGHFTNVNDRIQYWYGIQMVFRFRM